MGYAALKQHLIPILNRVQMFLDPRPVSCLRPLRCDLATTLLQQFKDMLCFPVLTLDRSLPESQGKPQHRDDKLHAPSNHRQQRLVLSWARIKACHSPAGRIASAVRWDLRRSVASVMSCLNNEGQPLVGGFEQRGAPAAACVFFLTLLWLRPLLASPAAAFFVFLYVCVLDMDATGVEPDWGRDGGGLVPPDDGRGGGLQIRWTNEQTKWN